MGKQPVGSQFIILVKGNTGGKSLVAEVIPKEPIQTSVRKRVHCYKLPDSESTKSSNHEITFLPPDGYLFSLFQP